MGTKTSVYLTDGLAASVAASGIPLATLIRRGLAVTARPCLMEDSPGGFVTVWFCGVPDEETRFRVLEDEWHQQPQADDGEVYPPVRGIYRIEVMQSDADPAAGDVAP